MFFNLFITFVVGVAVPAVGLFLIAGRVTGRARSFGMLGCGLLVVQGLLQMVYTGAIQLFYRSFGATGMGIVSGLFNGLAAIIGAAGLILVIAAAIAGRSAPTVPDQAQQSASYPTAPTYPTDPR